MKSIIRKPICLVLTLVLIIGSLVITASAAAGRTSIAFSKNNPKIGENVTVTVTFTTTTPMLGASGTLSYPSDILQYVSGTNTSNPSSGTVMLVSSQQNVKVASFSITFKVKKAGTANISLYDCLVSDINTEDTVTGSSVKMVTLSGNEGVTSQSSSSSQNKKSSNADLKSITVVAGTLTPAFSKDITEYRVTAPYDKTDGILSCKVADDGARLVFSGNRDLQVGLTKRKITVIAEDGTQKVYTVIFNRLDKDGNDTTKEPTDGDDSDIEVIFGGTKWFLTSDFAEEVYPAGFSAGVYKYGEQEVSCIKDPSGKLTALCLIDQETEEKKFFLYDIEKGFSEFNYIEQNGSTYVILESDEKTFTGYTKIVTEVLSMKVSGYVSQNDDLKDYIVLSVMSPDGTVGFYRFDTVQKSLQRYPEFGVTSEVKETIGEQKTVSSSKQIVLILLALALELIIAIIVIAIILTVKSIKKKLAAKKTNEEQEVYNIAEDSDEPDSNGGIDGEWIKYPDENSEE